MTGVARIHVAQIETDLFLAVSVDSPRFCVSGTTKEGAVAKAEKALAFDDSHKHLVRGVKVQDTTIVRPVFELQELRAV